MFLNLTSCWPHITYFIFINMRRSPETNVRQSQFNEYLFLDSRYVVSLIMGYPELEASDDTSTFSGVTTNNKRLV